MQTTEHHAYCLRCRTVAEPGEKRCVACGARFNPLPFRGVLYLALLAGLAALLAVGVLGLWSAARDAGRREQAKDEAPAPPKTTAPAASTTVAATVTPTTAATPAVVDPKPITAVSIEASATAGASQNSCGERTSYEAAKAQDGDPSTTWRVKGDGTGQTLVLRLAGPTRLTQVGLVPGFAKVDPCSGTDRFPQLRRVTSVTWLFDGGKKVDQTFVDKPTMQTTPVDVTTSTVTIEITGVTQNPTIDATPISEVQLLGAPVS